MDVCDVWSDHAFLQIVFGVFAADSAQFICRHILDSVWVG